MSARIGRSGLIAFGLLCCAMLANMLLLQPIGAGRPSLSVAPGTSLALSSENVDGEGNANGKNRELVVINSYDKQKTVRSIQRELVTQGYMAGAADGMPGLMTRAAIMAFEFDNGLPLNGRADPEFLKMLLLGPPPELTAGNPKARRVEGSEARRVVATIQQTLRQLGYKISSMDGTFGIETERAIRDFESDQDLRETGRVSGRLVSRLVGLADAGRIAMSR